MDTERNHRITWYGEFADKSIEDEFLTDGLSSSRTMAASIALVFGVILGLFLLHSYLTEGHTLLFRRITPVRSVFILVSLAVFFLARRIAQPRRLFLLITFYQAMMAVTYLLTLKHYDSLNYFSVIGLLVITLAMYLLPNKITLSQVVTIAFSIAFFAGPINKLEGLTSAHYYRIIAYQTILLVHCNINYWWAETAKRKAFLANKELLALSEKDPLTGLYNRKKFDDALEYWIDLAKRYGHELSIVLFDVDDFKGINDQYGHLMGDTVLKEIAAVASRIIRATDVFARWGGDEFVILLPHTSLEQAQKTADRIRTALSSHSFEVQENITCSVGVALCEADDTKKSLLRKVDDLLRRAKTGGKDRVIC